MSTDELAPGHVRYVFEVTAAIELDGEERNCWVPFGTIDVKTRTPHAAVLQAAGEKFSMIPGLGAPPLPARIVKSDGVAEGELFSESNPRPAVRMR